MPRWFLGDVPTPPPITCSLRAALQTDTQALQMPANLFASSGLPYLPALCPSHPALTFWTLSIPIQAEETSRHPCASRSWGEGAAETFLCVPITARLGISCHTPSLHCGFLGCLVPAVLWQHPGWQEPQLCPWWIASPSPNPPPPPTRLKAPLGSWASL